MTLDEFVKKWEGQPCDFDGKLGLQCMDLVEQYNKDVIGAPRIYGNANDLKNNASTKFYQYFPNSLTYIPPVGAIACWTNTNGGTVQHGSIVLSANILSFISLDENWPAGSRVHKQLHNYLKPKVAGFLVPRTLLNEQVPIGANQLPESNDRDITIANIISLLERLR
jgi:CHAP domain